MALLTESEIRRKLNKEDLKKVKEIYVSKKDIITPSAKSLLNERKIAIRYIEEKQEERKEEKKKEGKSKVVEQFEVVEQITKEVTAKNKDYKYRTIFGAKLQEKPEHMTSLRGDLLVFKDHPRIAFRGRIDSLESKILEVQVLAEKKGMPKLTADLQEVLHFVRNLIRCEVSGEELKEFALQGLTEAELRDQSHHPSKYFGMRHFLPDYRMGELVVALNSLRTQTRETELVAYDAFKSQYGEVGREDLILALNKLSSLFWIMMFKVRADQYKEEGELNGQSN